MKHPGHSPRKTGRPLSFDRSAALQNAMLLFWRHGYESTSLAALKAAMGVTAPSIYAAFGDKKQLFLEALKLYLSSPVTSQSIIDDAATARDAAAALLHAAATGFTGPETPPGCLLATSAISCSAEAEDVRMALAEIRHGIEAHLRSRIDRDIAAKKLPSGTDAATMAGLVMAVIQGMSTLARDGAPREHLLCVADTAMQSWPCAARGRRRAAA